MGRQKNKKKSRPFVSMLWELLNSMAYKELPPSAAKVLPIFIGRGQHLEHKTGSQSDGFKFSYTEAKNRYGIGYDAFAKAIRDLTAFGFIDPIVRGGLKGDGLGYNWFKCSDRWQTYGKPEFKAVYWERYLGKQPSYPQAETTRQSRVGQLGKAELNTPF